MYVSETPKDMELLSEDIKSITTEISYFCDSLPELVRKLKNIKEQFENLDKSEDRHVHSSVYTYLGKALIIGGIVGVPSTFGLSAAISIFGHILIACCPISELAFSETRPLEIKTLSIDVHEIVTELKDFKIHCEQAKSFYNSLCQHSVNYDCKYMYLLGMTLNELDIKFNAYFSHFDNMEKQETYKQAADKMLHDLDCSIKELMALQQKLYDIKKDLNQMNTLL